MQDWEQDNSQYDYHNQTQYQEPEYYYDNQQAVNNPYQPQAGSPMPPTAGYPQQTQQDPNEQLFSETFDSYAQDPVAGMAVKYGAQMMGERFGDVHGRFNMYLSFLKYYFDVDTSYVAKKLRIILLPFSNMSWKRMRVQDETTGELAFASPREDVNAPDLYIPLMSFVTLVVLVGFSMGVLSDKFHPEVLGTTASSAIICIFLEAVLLKLGFFLISTDFVPPFLDILAYCGYIFVSVVVNLAVGMVFNSLVYHICTIISSFMIGIFLVRSMRDFLLAPGDMGNKRRQIFLVGIVVAQIFLAWFMGSLADWSTHSDFELRNIPRDLNLDLVGLTPEEPEGILTNTAVL